jgi:hypothetical protein
MIAPQGLRRKAWGFNPRSAALPASPSPIGTTDLPPQFESGAPDPSPRWGLGGWWRAFLGLKPQALCLSPCGALRMVYPLLGVGAEGVGASRGLCCFDAQKWTEFLSSARLTYGTHGLKGGLATQPGGQPPEEV